MKQTITIDGVCHEFDDNTHLVEVRATLRGINTARRQKGWIVGNFVQDGQGCYVFSRATVLRPLWPREIREIAESRLAANRAYAARAAEFAALPEKARIALRNTICLRKGKVRLDKDCYRELTGKEYTGKSPYGPRLGKFLVSVGVPPENLQNVIKRHVSGLKPW